jgi:signal transduction histidine kinase
VTENAAIRDWMRRPQNADTTAAAEALARITGADTTMPGELRVASGHILRAGSYPADWDAATIDSARSAIVVTDAEGGWGPVFMVGDEPWIWFVVPLEPDGSATVARLRRLRASSASSQIRELIGPSAGIYYANTRGRMAVTMEATRVDLPFEGMPPSTVTYTRDGRAWLLNAAPVEHTALAVVTEIPLADVLARPDRFLRRALVAAAILMAIGAIGAWIVSRGITRPVKALGEAARSIAGGNYSSRVRLQRSDELGTLADAFNAMARDIEAAQAGLRHKYEEARELADRLEVVNTRLREAMSAAEQARLEAVSANRAKSDFLATMSHEIRTPINAIIGYTEILRLGITGPVTAEQEQQLDRIDTSGRHLIAIVDDVLDLARIESGHLNIADQSATFGDAIDAVFDVVGPVAEQAGIILRRAADSNVDATYRGDAQRVRQILINLACNAVKFTSVGGTVEIGAGITDDNHDETGMNAFVYVRDTGIGIPESEIERIFEPFVQGVRGYTRSHGGVGLGLSISRQLARSMGGELSVVSTPGEGSTFTLRLPAAAGRLATV